MEKVKLFAAVCILIAFASLAFSAYALLIVESKIDALGKANNLVIYNGVVTMKTDGSGALELQRGDFSLRVSVTWFDVNDSFAQLRLDMRQDDALSSTEFYYMAPNDVKVGTFRGYTVQAWYMSVVERKVPATIQLKVTVVNIGSPSLLPQDLGVLYSGDVEFSKGFREELSATYPDFSFKVHVESIDYKQGKVALSYLVSQGGVDRHGQIVNAGSNDVIIEEFRGYTMKLWIRKIIPPSSANPEPSVIINIRIVH